MPTTLIEIFRDSETHHRLSLFDLPDLKAIEAGLFEKNGKPYLKCLATDKDRPAKPEEIVRQLWIHKLIHQYGYPKSRIAVEHPVKFGSETKRADIVVFDKDRPTVEYIMVELKKTKLKDGKDQLKSYCNATGAPIGVWSNGEQYSFYNRKDPNYFNDLTEIPSATQSLTDILNERFTSTTSSSATNSSPNANPSKTSSSKWRTKFSPTPAWTSSRKSSNSSSPSSTTK